jgi:sulfatase modifying factor 1
MNLLRFAKDMTLFSVRLYLPLCCVLFSLLIHHIIAYPDLDKIYDDEGCGCSGSLSRDSSLSSDTSIDINQLSQIHDVSDTSLRRELSNNANMVYIAVGDTFMGTGTPIMKKDGEHPRRPITLSPYFMDTYEVSNSEFVKFVEATEFETESERYGWSFVFHTAIKEEIKAKITQAVLGAEWWLPVNGSYWREPEGPGSDVFTTNRSNHPVVQVSWNDAVAYCKWRGSRLPTEAEWEVAARGPKPISAKQPVPLFPWGNKLMTNDNHRMNIFHGEFPVQNLAEDGYEFTAPVDAFEPQNAYGFYNLIGNVWEWVEDWNTIYHDKAHKVNPAGPATGREKVKKGGSFLCHRTFCYRYRTVARFPSTPDSATQNVGFRCARSASNEEIAQRSNTSVNHADGIERSEESNDDEL